MKNKFSFAGLAAEKRDFNVLDKEKIFFSMRDVIRRGGDALWVSDFSELGLLMTDDEYYIAINIVVKKGKECFFRENLVSSLKGSLLDYLKGEVDMASGYSRPFIISPLFTEKPSYVILITEEAGIIYYK
ncbi:hypothetical protein FEK43_22370 [Escherichia sp. E2562]|uniref:hypothetical protein n=2 Tax=Escherichia sp. E2562 TaxID=2041646 RepID=UPI0010FD9B0A|nr:hypothetical protein [Escherichia sp. E2562]TLI77877.1 hypothetical protein FEK43_22370 [Escherichia sp. E2562]